MRPSVSAVRCCTLPSSSANAGNEPEKTATQRVDIALKVPKKVLPSIRIIKKYTNTQIFLRLLLEMEHFYGSEENLPDHLSDGDWEKYIHLTGIIERCCFLSQLYDSRRHYEFKAAREILEDGEEQEAGRGAEFNTLFLFDRRDYRRFAYEVFGNRLLAAWKCGEQQVPFLIDCCYLTELSIPARQTVVRYVKDFILDNCLHRHPFPITLVNYKADLAIAHSIINAWTRKRCPSKYYIDVGQSTPDTSGDCADAAVNEGCKKKRQFAPFSPFFTSQGVRQCLGDIQEDEIAYINPKAESYLPTPLTKYKAFVLCATMDRTFALSSYKAASSEELRTYRLPLTNFTSLGKTDAFMSPKLTANILRDALHGESDWETIFKKHIPYFKTLAASVFVDFEKEKSSLEGLEQWLASAEQKATRKRIYRHKYSREERREMRKREMTCSE